MNGESYSLKQSSGIGDRMADVWVEYNQTKNFTYIFEPIPDGTKSLDIVGERISFLGVSLSGKAADLSKATPSLILTNEGLGCLKKGMLFTKIPTKCIGLYDRYEKTLIEDEMDGNYTLYSFYSAKDKVADIAKYGNTITRITVYSSNISTPEGVHPGMPISKLLLMNGVKGSYNDGLCLTYKGYSINFDGLNQYGEKSFNDAYAKGSEVKLSNACFKKDAKVISISY